MPPNDRRRPSRAAQVQGNRPARLVRAWLDGHDADFDEMAEGLVSAGQEADLAEAVRLVGQLPCGQAASGFV